MGKQKEMSYGFHVSVQGSTPEDVSKMSEEKRNEILKKLGRQFITDGLHCEEVTTYVVVKKSAFMVK